MPTKRVIGPSRPNRGPCEQPVTDEPVYIPEEEPIPAFPEAPTIDVPEPMPIPVTPEVIQWR